MMDTSQEASLLAQLERAKVTKNDHQIDEALIQIADFYRSNGELDKLIEISQQRYQNLLHKGFPSDILIDLAGNLNAAGRYEDALHLMEQTRADIAKAGGGDTEHFLATLTEIYLNTQDFAQAVATTRKQVELARNNPNYSDYWETLGFLADIIQYRLDDCKGCIPEREELWRHFREGLHSSKLTASAMTVHVKNGARLAHAYRQTGKLEKAVPVYISLIEDLKKSLMFSEASIEVSYLLTDLAQAQLESGSITGMKKSTKEAIKLIRKYRIEDSTLDERIAGLKTNF